MQWKFATWTVIQVCYSSKVLRIDQCILKNYKGSRSRVYFKRTFGWDTHSHIKLQTVFVKKQR